MSRTWLTQKLSYLKFRVNKQNHRRGSRGNLQKGMLLKHGANISIKDTVSVPLVQTQHMLIIIHCVQFIESAMYTCIMGTKLKERE